MPHHFSQTSGYGSDSDTTRSGGCRSSRSGNWRDEVKGKLKSKRTTREHTITEFQEDGLFVYHFPAFVASDRLADLPTTPLKMKQTSAQRS